MKAPGPWPERQSQARRAPEMTTPPPAHAAGGILESRQNERCWIESQRASEVREAFRAAGARTDTARVQNPWLAGPSVRSRVEPERRCQVKKKFTVTIYLDAQASRFFSEHSNGAHLYRVHKLQNAITVPGMDFSSTRNAMVPKETPVGGLMSQAQAEALALHPRCTLNVIQNPEPAE